MKSLIFKTKKGGGSYLFFDKRKVKWTIERVQIENTVYWIGESEKDESLREPLKKHLLNKINKLPKRKRNGRKEVPTDTRRTD